MRFILPILYVVLICTQITFLFIILKDMMTDRIELLEHQQESNKKVINHMTNDRSHIGNNSGTNGCTYLVDSVE